MPPSGSSSQENLSPGQARWKDDLASYDLDIQCRPGHTNVVADALSQRPDFCLTLTIMTEDDAMLHSLQTAYQHDKSAFKFSAGLAAPM